MSPLEWTFSIDNAGFIENQKVKLHRERLVDNSYYLICQSKQKTSTPGIKLSDIILPNDGYEYCMEVEGFANNKKTFLWIADGKNVRLFKNYVYLPELIGQDHKPSAVKLYFKQNNANKESKFTNISIGILISNSITNDIFFIKSVKLYQCLIDNPLPNPQLVKITRVYDSILSLNENQVNPIRDNNTPMEAGEYALLNSDHEGSDHGNLYIAYIDKNQTESQISLKYISNIKSGSNGSILQMLKIAPNQIIPIYDDPSEAKKDLAIHGNKFYDKTIETSRIGQITSDDKPYMYFDSKGYVRWITLQ
jgi:hypothetical protein